MLFLATEVFHEKPSLVMTALNGKFSIAQVWLASVKLAQDLIGINCLRPAGCLKASPIIFEGRADFIFRSGTRYKMRGGARVHAR